MRKINLDEEVKKEEISEEIRKKIYRKTVFKHIIYSSLYYILMMLSIIFEKKVTFFSKVFSIIFGGNNQISIIIYYVILSLGFILHLVVAIYSELASRKLSNWYKSSYRLNKLLDPFTFIINSFSIILFMIIFAITPCSVSGASMNDTLKNGDKLICSDLFYKPSKGDIIIFDSSNYTKQAEIYIKRIVAVEGSEIFYDENDGHLYIDKVDVEVVDKNEYLNMLLSVYDTSYRKSFIVPKGYLLVMGDNRKNSTDSRAFGLIKRSDIYGRVLFRFYPFPMNVEDKIKK